MHVATDLDRTRISAKLAHVDEFFEFREAQAHRIGTAVDGDHDAVEIQLAESAIATDADLAADANVVRRGLIATDFITELEAVELLGLAGAALVFFRHETTEARGELELRDREVTEGVGLEGEIFVKPYEVLVLE